MIVFGRCVLVDGWQRETGEVFAERTKDGKRSGGQKSGSLKRTSRRVTSQKVTSMAPRPFILPLLCLLSSAFFEAILAESIVFNIFSTRTNDQLLFVHNVKDVGANWTILPFEGEEQHIFDEMRRHIQTDDRPKAFVQIDGQTITQRLYQEPFCWLRGICWRRNRTAETFVFCNGRLAEILRLLRMNGCESAEEKGGEEAERTDEFNEVGWSTTFLAVEATPNGQSGKKGGKGTNSKNKLNTDGKMMSEGDQRRMCRYRITCYEKMGFSHLIGKQQKQLGGKVLSGKMAPPEGSKRTMKQMAKVAIKGVEKSEAEGKTKKELDERDGETVLANYRSGRERKLRCKYRKSCYRSGLRPTIESNLLALWLNRSGTKGYGEEEGNKSEEAGREAEWDTLDTKQRKVFCRYRKSCYSNGSRTMGKSEWRWDDFEIDFGFTQKTSEYWSNLRKMVKGRKGVAKKTGDETEMGGPKEEEAEEDTGEEAQRRKLSCKYRRSCYKTGELPEALRTPEGRTEEGGAEGAAMGRKRVPTSVRELKVFCKYRKSCYLASATGTETAEAMRAESSQNKTSGQSEKEEEWVEKIGEEVQKLTERQKTKRSAVANNDQTDGRREEGEEKREEEEHGAEVSKKRSNKKKKRTEVSEAPKNGEDEVKRKEDEMKREEEKQLNRNEREQEEENRKEKKEKPKRGGQRKPKTSCSPEKWVKEKKVDPGGCREKRDKEGVEGEKEKKAEETQKTKKKTKRKEEVKLEEETNKETEATEIGGEKEKTEGLNAEKEEKEIKERKKQQYKPKKRTYKVQVAEVQGQKSKVWSRNWLGLSSAERLECRYRKSCYATGTRPTSQRWTIGGDEKWWRCWEWHNLWRAVPWIFEEQQKKEKAHKSNKIEGWEGLSDRARKQKCQYRKSCYDRMEPWEGSGTEGDGPNGRTDSARKKEKPRPRKAADFTPKTVSREADKRKREETLRREVIFKSVDMATKLHCKYRKSCYEGSADRIMAPPPIILVGKKNETVVIGGRRWDCPSGRRRRLDRTEGNCAEEGKWPTRREGKTDGRKKQKI
uniref:Uncharacterized protein n=1 Tax=Globodera rostochiensis TaxID=31243 RepID=A0A914HC42_GLORO